MPLLGRAAGFFVLLLLTIKIFARGMAPADSGFVLGILDGANLIFHEAGHIIFLPFGNFLHYLGGSLTQVAIPAALAGYFWRERQRSAVAVTVFWTGESLTNVAVYVSDARRMELELIGGDHDWNYLLDRLNLISRADALGGLVFFTGMLSIAFSLFLFANELIRSWQEPEAI